MALYSSWVLAKCSSCIRLHSLFAWAKSGRWLNDCWVLPSAFIVRIQCFEFWILSALVAVLMCFSTAILSYNIMWCSFQPMVTTNLCSLLRRIIVKESLDGVRVFPVGPLSAFVSPGNTSFVFQKVRASLHDCCLFLITHPGIEVTSRLFWSNSVGLRVDFIFLPQLQ